ncbi:hypothetical protein B0T26DRAFT_809190 [Lasiosphaeria miniovina]|uniref:RRM domain-containing protein n=1 Tax=Lasiosphaeria miniovina TaxID=1954250 RepID=A0AA40BIP7_9PEZI|nr:uncharacterized protein B0T26DRAFT_809190 [Lasiosphaeria miniovina]KAK0734952.1 hypothetical protein B0T26DRAFT_809190 [Lasiosphaeria miniovina]
MDEEPEYLTFPVDRTFFDDDPRISFDLQTRKHIAVQEDGTEYEFDDEQRHWILITDEEAMVEEALIREYQNSYILHDVNDTHSGLHGKKRKNNASNDQEESNGRSNKQARRQGNRPPPQPKQNTAVYVTGIPLDATVDEVAELFSRKCGVIAEEIDSGRKRIKMYTDENGKFKGDALIVFFKPESVRLAIDLLDDSYFSMTDFSSGKIRVEAAESSYKKTKYETTGDAAADGNAPTSNTTATPATGAAKRSGQDKAKIIRKTQKLDAKLADWDDDEPPKLFPGGKAVAPKWEKVVILRHMFTLQELEADPAALLDIKEDIREECEKLGEVTNVVLFDEEEEGIVSVRFKSPEAAQQCVHRMHGRAFDGRTVEAFFATGKEKFRKSTGTGQNDDDEHDE